MVIVTLAGMVLPALALLLLLVAAILAGNKLLSAPGYRGPVSGHFDGVRFRNRESNGAPGSGEGFSGAGMGSNRWKWRENRFRARPRERVWGREVVVTFVNHATVLIQTAGVNILTDPVWSWRAGPLPFLGPRRYRDPGVRFEDLPPIDLVLVSHNHYDHLDLPTLRRLRAKWRPRIYTGLGNAAYLKHRHIGGAVDLDWWDRRQVGGTVAVVAVPARHFSARALSDRDRTLWCGFVLETPAGDIFFAGDTAYGPFIGEIHRQWREFRLALLPIGAFLPRRSMQAVHTSPDEALAMHHELGARISVGIHFGTFPMAADGQDVPAERVGELLRQAPEPAFILLENGQSLTVRDD